MALQAVYGAPNILVGPGLVLGQGVPSTTTITADAANEAAIYVGQVLWSDGGSHTIDTTGSSSIGWLTGIVTFANAGTTLKVGIADVDAANGPPGRAANAADVISFDVSASFTGGGGGVTGSAWQTSVPTSGTKTIANGALVAVCIQMTARAGADTVAISFVTSNAAFLSPVVTGFTGGSYATVSGSPNVIVTASDGTVGYLQGAEIFASMNTRTWNSGSATKEYGQLYKLPFPTQIYGAFGNAAPGGDLDIVLYSDPLGTPVAEKTASMDANTVSAATGRKFIRSFGSPYTTTADQLIGIVFKPGGTNISAYYRTLNAAGHRVADVWGAQGYGISRASGAFANANSSLDHYYIGLVAGAFDAGGGGTAGGIRYAGRGGFAAGV